MRPVRRALAVWLALLVVPGAAACGAGDGGSEGARDGAGSITVFAAASLSEAFGAVETAFEGATGAKVTISFGPSSGLAAQIGQGAPADVFASADHANAAKVADRASGSPVDFAANRLQIAVAEGNPKRVRTLADLARPGLVYITANPDVPIGRYAAEALGRAGVTVRPRSLEVDVKALVTKVRLGEADAAIVYETDVKAAEGAVDGVDIPDAQNVVARYPIVILRGGTGSPDRARDFVVFVTEGEGATILRSYGFRSP